MYQETQILNTATNEYERTPIVNTEFESTNRLGDNC